MSASGLLSTHGTWDRAEELFRSVIGEPDGPSRLIPTGRAERVDVGDFRVEEVDLEGLLADDWEPDFESNQTAVELPFFPVDREELERGLEEEGVEFLAVYAPYTFWGKRWGIYFFVDRIVNLAVTLIQDNRPLRVNPGLVPRALVRMIRHHELMHFRSELASAHFRSATDFDHYQLYHRLHSWGAAGSDGLEEAMGNAEMFGWGAANEPAVARAFQRRTPLMPYGYRDHGKYRSRSRRHRGLTRIASRILGSSRKPPTDLLELGFASIYTSSVPTYYVYGYPLPAWVDDLVGGRALRHLSLKDVLRHAEAHGEVKTGGRHQRKVVYRGRSVGLQDHPKINRRIPDHIIKQLADLFGLSRREYVEAVLAA